MSDEGNDPDKNDQKEPDGTEPKEPKEPEGGPDWELAGRKYKSERDALKERNSDLTSQLDGLKAQLGDAKSADDVKKAVDEALAKATSDHDASDAKWDAKVRALAVDAELAKAGCIDTDAARTHVDMTKVEVADDGKVSGVDAKKLKETYPYLFGTRTNAGSTGLKPDGAATDMDARINKAMGL